jgi:hypothetical protein
MHLMYMRYIQYCKQCVALNIRAGFLVGFTGAASPVVSLFSMKPAGKVQ